MSAGDKALKAKSPAQFFADNKNIAGFDNPGKSLYTTIRELVENSLDAAESIGELPTIELTIEEIGQDRFNHMIGIGNTTRKDESLYTDFLEAKAQQKKQELDAKKKSAKATKEAAPAASAKEKPPPGPRSKSIHGIYKVTCKDNGQGMHHKDIPNMLGRVLSGTKYGVKQTRGKFGLGAKMALLWSKMSTGLPITVESSRKKQDFISKFVLDIDIHQNCPNIHKEEKLPNTDKWHGAELSVVIEGNWTTYRAKILKYLRQLAVITPYACFKFRYVADGEGGKGLDLTFQRRTEFMPEPPCETKHHPSSVHVELLKQLRDNTKQKTLLHFLMKEFTSIGKDYASRLIKEMGKEYSDEMDIKAVSDKQMVQVHQLLREVHFDEADGLCLSPAGEYNLRLGIMKELRPSMVATCNAGVHVYEGHPFVVEAGVSLGGKEVPSGLNVFRFANRIPLLFEGGNDVATRVASKLKWDAYKIDQGRDRVGIFVSIVSTKIPFKGTSKEYIGEDATPMAEAVERALKQCCSQLRAKLLRAQADKERRERKKALFKYIPDVTRAMFAVLQEAAARPDQALPPAKRMKLDRAGKDPAETRKTVVGLVQSGKLTEAALESKLTAHVEASDNDQGALELQMKAGKAAAAKELVYLPHLRPSDFGPELHSTACALRLLVAP